MCSCVSFQIERIIESFSAKCTQVSLNIRMAFHMTIQEPLQSESLGTYATYELVWIVFRNGDVFLILISNPVSMSIFNCQWIFNAVSSIDKL